VKKKKCSFLTLLPLKDQEIILIIHKSKHYSVKISLLSLYVAKKTENKCTAFKKTKHSNINGNTIYWIKWNFCAIPMCLKINILYDHHNSLAQPELS